MGCEYQYIVHGPRGEAVGCDAPGMADYLDFDPCPNARCPRDRRKVNLMRTDTLCPVCGNAIVRTERNKQCTKCGRAWRR
jgi:hypothetical protein